MLTYTVKAHARTSQQVENRLERLLASLIWSFGEHSTCHAITSEPSKMFNSTKEYTCLTSVNIHKLQGLLNPDLTLRELCLLQFDLAAIVSKAQK